MKKLIVLILIVPIFLVFGENIDSTKATLNFKNEKILNVEKKSYKGAAPILSFFIPGGGHFYLGNYKTGIAYGSTRLLIIPGIKLMLDSGLGLPGTKNKTKGYLGLTLCGIGGISWILDVIHASISAKDYQPTIYEDKKRKVDYTLIPDFEKKQIKLSLNYTFK